MQNGLRFLAAVGVAALGIASGPALADSITPTTFEATIAVGGVASVAKTVTVDEGRPTTAAADIYFMSDTTGSMGPAIGAVQAGFASIIASLRETPNNAVIAIGKVASDIS